MSDDDPIGRRNNASLQDPFLSLREMFENAKGLMKKDASVNLNIVLSVDELVEVALLLKRLRNGS